MDRNIFVIILVIVLVVFMMCKRCENYASGSFDITSSITTNMDWKGATLSKVPYYTNNIVNPPNNVLNQIQQLQKYQPSTDGQTDTTYVATNMKVEQNIDNPSNREGFSMMNPYVSQM